MGSTSQAPELSRLVPFARSVQRELLRAVASEDPLSLVMLEHGLEDLPPPGRAWRGRIRKPWWRTIAHYTLHQESH